VPRRYLTLPDGLNDPAPEQKTLRVNFCVDGSLEAARAGCEQLAQLRGE